MQRTEKQREASRINGSKSKGPITPTGKDVSKFNGLKHGLRAEHVILPGEDPAQFEAERQTWINDWKPPSHTRAVLVERAAIASWRLNRSVRAEAAFLAQRAETAGNAFDFERFGRVDRAVSRADSDPGGARVLLEMDATGLDRLIASCGELERALGAGPSGWNQTHYHMRLMMVAGYRLDENPHYAGGVPCASARLLAANNPEFAARPCFDYGHGVVVFPLPEAEREAAAETLRRAVASELERLRELRRGVPDPCELRRRAVAAAYCDGTEEGKLRHRYEMAIDRGLRATIGQLMALEKSGADLAGASDEAGAEGEASGGHESEVAYPQEVASTDWSLASSCGAAAPGSLGAVESVPIPASAGASPRRPEGPIRAPEPGGGGGSRA